MRQLSGIGGGQSLGFGPNRVRSLPDGVAQALSDYLADTANEFADSTSRPGVFGNNGYHSEPEPTVSEEMRVPVQATQQIGDLCPECGQAAVVNEEGCRKCYACGYSEC
jgi:ribonucleoside-diphosphate reductase alpha chain